MTLSVIFDCRTKSFIAPSYDPKLGKLKDKIIRYSSYVTQFFSSSKSTPNVKDKDGGDLIFTFSSGFFWQSNEGKAGF